MAVRRLKLVCNMCCKMLIGPTIAVGFVGNTEVTAGIRPGTIVLLKNAFYYVTQLNQKSIKDDPAGYMYKMN